MKHLKKIFGKKCLPQHITTRADITFPKALRERLILVAYFIPSPVAPVLAALSEPARSTRFNLEALYF